MILYLIIGEVLMLLALTQVKFCGDLYQRTRPGSATKAWHVYVAVAGVVLLWPIAIIVSIVAAAKGG